MVNTRRTKRKERRQRKDSDSEVEDHVTPSPRVVRKGGAKTRGETHQVSGGDHPIDSEHRVDGGSKEQRTEMSDLAKVKLKVKCQREVFDDVYADLDAALGQTEKDVTMVGELMRFLEAENSDLAIMDEELQTTLFNSMILDEEEYHKEVKIMKSYKWRAMSILERARQVVNGDTGSVGGGTISKKSHRLPKLELPKFGGEPKEWLPFWSQFETIHHDESLTDVVKFQYLLQCMNVGSSAKQLVSSYPVTEKNYELVVDCLKSRFGREDMLVEVYVRDLIGMILENASTKKTKDFSSQFVKLSAQLRALGTLGVTSDRCASILYPMVESSLPEDVLVAWERHRQQTDTNASSKSEDLLEKLMVFLKQEVEGNERIQMARNGFSSQGTEFKSGKPKKIEIPTAAGLLATKEEPRNQRGKDSCVFCGKSSHSSESCYTASNLSMEAKRKLVDEGRRCFRCLKSGHQSKKCKFNVKCIVCGHTGHWAVMCRSLQVEERKEAVAITKPSSSMGNEVRSQEVLLMTMIVRVHGSKSWKDVRALVDTGSQKSYVLEDTSREVGLSVVGKEEVIHQLFGGSLTKPQTYQRVQLKLSDPDENFLCDFAVSAISCISNQLRGVPHGPWLSELKGKGINITDVGRDSGKIEVLIGSDVAARLMTGKKVDLGSGPTALQTKLGWTLCGKISHAEPTTENITNSNMSLAFHNLDQITNLWDLDVIGITDPATKKTREELETAAFEHFNSTITKNDEGRFEVHLPWIEGHSALPTNKVMAEKRLLNATQRVKKDGTLEGYNTVFEGWLAEGIIENVPTTELENYGHFLPHRPVYKPESMSTPIRPVFDASAKTRGNPSLNECLEKGPNLLEQIPDILIRFRWNNVGVTADIKKAFLQMSVAKDQRDFMRFLWWEDTTCKRMKQFRHCRVVFGISSSPFLLGATLKHQLQLWKDDYPDVVTKLDKSFYVDNCVTSVSNLDEADEFRAISQHILQDGMFDLRGWEFGPSENAKIEPILGIKWNLKDDYLFCDVDKISCIEDKITKRIMLSDVNGIYDPLGILCGFTIVPKILLQAAWKLKIGWDDPLPRDITDKYLKWRNQVRDVNLVKVPRRITQNGGVGEYIELHIFVDASGSAYSACVFLRSKRGDDINVQLVMARSRVTPLKAVTISRLELLGCVIGARLGDTVLKSLNLKVPVHYWTDSSTALSWIQGDSEWGMFVANRVKEIRHLTFGARWHHVPGELNPADLPSRGSSIRTLLERRWWEGASWLSQDEEMWPKSNVKVNEDEVNAEKRKTVVSAFVCEENQLLQDLWRRSDYHKILRIMSYVLRFLHNCRAKKERSTKKTGNIDLEETTLAEVCVLKLVQHSSFGGVTNPKLKKLRACVNSCGLICVKTRLVMGDFEDQFKYPILLPAKHEMVKRIIMKYHLETCHAGVQILQAQLREKFWIINSRRTIRNVLRNCLKCQKLKAKHVEVDEPPLPATRVQISYPFAVTGVDLFGPLYLRGQRKAWVVIFACANFRCVHLELTTTMSTEGFLKCLRRFVARRGRPNTIYSDNGRNFCGAANLFSKVEWSKVEDYATVTRMKWIFNAPAAPWWGGWYERLIGIVKKMMIAVLDHARINQEELNTLLCDIEAMVNQRPLTYVSEDVDDLEPLTPAKFLRSECGVLPEADVVDSTVMNAQFKHVQSLREELNSRFRKEYLGQLKHVSKLKKSREVAVGDVVLVEDDMKKRIDWPMGIVIQTIPGRDSKIRTVKVRTKSGCYTRAVQRIFPLELNENNPFLTS